MTSPPLLDLVTTGTVYCDLVFTGLAAPPAPGTEVRTTGLEVCPGGVANVAVAAARLGLRTGLAATLGDDPAGRSCWQSLAAEPGLDLARSLIVPGWRTATTASLAYAGERSMVTYEVPPPETVARLAAALPRSRAAYALLGAGPGGAGPGAADWVAARARAGEFVVADAGWDDTGRWDLADLAGLAHVDAFLPNAAEAMAYTRTASPAAALGRLAERVPVVAVTDGGRGAIGVDQRTGERAQVGGLAVEALDTTGAGDVFAAAFTAATLAGRPLVERLRLANLCAALSVRGAGGSPSAPGWDDVARWMRQARAADADLRRDYGFLDDLVLDRPEPASS